jgi:hypothetical protein
MMVDQAGGYARRGCDAADGSSLVSVLTNGLDGGLDQQFPPGVGDDPFEPALGVFRADNLIQNAVRTPRYLCVSRRS